MDFPTIWTYQSLNLEIRRTCAFFPPFPTAGPEATTIAALWHFKRKRVNKATLTPQHTSKARKPDANPGYVEYTIYG